MNNQAACLGKTLPEQAVLMEQWGRTVFVGTGVVLALRPAKYGHGRVTGCELEMTCTGLEAAVPNWWAWEEFLSAATVLGQAEAALLGFRPSA